MSEPRSRSPAAMINPFLAAVVLLLLLCPPARGQDTGRIWGRVGTTAGDIHEGFLRWDRNEGSWVDVLDGSKHLAWEKVREWSPDPELNVTSGDRVIEYGGYRITWDDDEADFPRTAESGIRFGHLERIRVTGEQEVEVVLRSGESAHGAGVVLRSGGALGASGRPIVVEPAPGVTVTLEGGSTDLGPEVREILVDVPGGRLVELEWEDLEWVELGPPPEGAVPRAARLYGTVEDRGGRRFTGAIAWGNDEALVTDTLDGEDPRGREREIPFSRIASVRPTEDGAEVILNGGERLRLSDSDDVDDDMDIQVSDPGLGRVGLEWDDVASVRFHPPKEWEEKTSTYGAFDGVHRLEGTVVTSNGDELTGWIRWDADEEYSWELLDGSEDGIRYDVELGKIASIERASSRSARVTLLDGRILELRGSNDVSEDNKGILVRTAELEASEDPEAEKWIRVRWEDFEVLRLDHREAGSGAHGGEAEPTRGR